MTIKNIETAELSTIIAGLVAQGLGFECVPGRVPGTWNIELTGAF